MPVCFMGYITFQAKVQSPSTGPSTNPFLSSPTNNADQPIVDLFGAPAATAVNEAQVEPSTL